MLLRNGKTYSIQINKLETKQKKIKENIKIIIYEKENIDDNDFIKFKKEIKSMLDEVNRITGIENKLNIVIKMYKYILNNRDIIRDKIKYGKFINIVQKKYMELVVDVEKEINKRIGENLLKLNKEFIDMKDEVMKI